MENYKEKTLQEVNKEYKEKLEKEFPIAFSILEIGGVHPDKQEPMTNPYLCNLEQNKLDKENFGNVGEHCVSVAICANKIADALLKEGLIDKNTYSGAIGRALIHDANKRFEVFRRKAQKEEVLIEVYNKSAYETMYEEIIKTGIQESEPLVEYLKNAGKETGHSSLVDFIEIYKEGNPSLKKNLTIEEMIVHLADDMTASPLQEKTQNTETEFTTIKERMELGNFPDRYGFLYEEGFGFDENNNSVILENCSVSQEASNLKLIKTYTEWQQIVAADICKKLQCMIDSENNDDPEEFMKDLVNRKL